MKALVLSVLASVVVLLGACATESPHSVPGESTTIRVFPGGQDFEHHAWVGFISRSQGSLALDWVGLALEAHTRSLAVTRSGRVFIGADGSWWEGRRDTPGIYEVDLKTGAVTLLQARDHFDVPYLFGHGEHLYFQGKGGIREFDPEARTERLLCAYPPGMISGPVFTGAEFVFASEGRLDYVDLASGSVSSRPAEWEPDDMLCAFVGSDLYVFNRWSRESFRLGADGKRTPTKVCSYEDMFEDEGVIWAAGHRSSDLFRVRLNSMLASERGEKRYFTGQYGFHGCPFNSEEWRQNPRLNQALEKKR